MSYLDSAFTEDSYIETVHCENGRYYYDGKIYGYGHILSELKEAVPASSEECRAAFGQVAGQWIPGGIVKDYSTNELYEIVTIGNASSSMHDGCSYMTLRNLETDETIESFNAFHTIEILNSTELLSEILKRCINKKSIRKTVKKETK